MAASNHTRYRAITLSGYKVYQYILQDNLLLQLNLQILKHNIAHSPDW